MSRREARRPLTWPRLRLTICLVMSDTAHLLASPLQAAEEANDNTLLFLNCLVVGEVFGLTTGEMAQGLLNYIPNETYSERNLAACALQNFLDACEAFPQKTQRHEHLTLDTPMALFDESSDSSEQRLEAFGPIEWGGTEGLDMASHIGRHQIWNYILSGETSFPITPIDLDEARAWQPEIINHLGGESPGSEECAVVTYRTARSEINRVLRGSVGYVSEMREVRRSHE